MDKLVTLKIDATANIMPNRVKGFEFKEDNAMNQGESEVAVRTDDKLCITKWKDNKSVLMISTAFGREPGTETSAMEESRGKRMLMLALNKQTKECFETIEDKVPNISISNHDPDYIPNDDNDSEHDSCHNQEVSDEEILTLPESSVGVSSTINESNSNKTQCATITAEIAGIVFLLLTETIIEKRWKLVRAETLGDVQKYIVSAWHERPFKVLQMGCTFLDFDKAAESVMNTKKMGHIECVPDPH
ncbi:hypothetical protein JTB14_007451 [Gonioctena quinquepunctata]|nr:hypothetical protein JTB14_007451 [Gonioctena quinquepunctata]